MAAVQRLVQEDRRVTTLQIVEEVGISSGSVGSILQKSLGLSKVEAIWVPHMLTDEQKQKWVHWCHFILDKFDVERSNAVWDIISGDDTWLYCFDPETKQQSQQWIPVRQRTPQKFLLSCTIAKQMIAVFVNHAGHVLTILFVTKKKIASAWYTTEHLPCVLAAVAERHPQTKHRRLLLHHDNATADRAAATQDFLNDGNNSITGPLSLQSIFSSM